MSMCISTAQARAKKKIAPRVLKVLAGLGRGHFHCKFRIRGLLWRSCKIPLQGVLRGPVRVLSCGNPVKIFFRRSLWESLANAMS